MGKGKSCKDVFGEEPATFFFWSLIVVLFVLVIGNFVLTLSIISFFKLGFGMKAFELVPEAKAIKFFGETDFHTIFKKDGLIEGFKDDPMVVESDDSEIRFDLIDRKGHSHNRFKMSSEGTEINNVREFTVRDPDTKKPIFSTASKLKWNFEKPMKKLETTSILGSVVSSPIDTKLLVESLNMFIQGAEGTKIDSNSQLISAAQNIHLKSYNGSIVLDTPNIYFNYKILPTIEANLNIFNSNLKYKLCVCYPKGVLYRASYPKGRFTVEALNKMDICKDASKQYCM